MSVPPLAAALAPGHDFYALIGAAATVAVLLFISIRNAWGITAWIIAHRQ